MRIKQSRMERAEINLVDFNIEAIRAIVKIMLLINANSFTVLSIMVILTPFQHTMLSWKDLDFMP